MRCLARFFVVFKGYSRRSCFEKWEVLHAFVQELDWRSCIEIRNGPFGQVLHALVHGSNSEILYRGSKSSL